MAGKLQPLQVERLVTPGKYADGDGLYFVVAGANARSWSYRYWFNGKERWYGLGRSRTCPCAMRASRATLLDYE